MHKKEPGPSDTHVEALLVPVLSSDATSSMEVEVAREHFQVSGAILPHDGDILALMVPMVLMMTMVLYCLRV